MNNLKSLYLDQMLFDLCDIDSAGIPLKTPATKAPPAKGINNPMNFSLPESLAELYGQFHYLQFQWHLQQSDIVIERIKNTSFIQENYLNKEDVTWEMVNEHLSGYINITPSDLIFDPGFCEKQSYYHWLETHPKEGNAADFFALDTSADITACLKRENNVIADSVWLIYPEADKISHMNVSIETYFDLAYKSRGMRLWQQVFLEGKKSFYYELMKWFLPAINPNVKIDLNLFGM